MPRPFLPSSLLTCLLAAAPLSAQAPAEAPAPLGQATTEALCARYDTAGHWVQQAVILLSLNTWWHPAGSSMIVKALQDKDARLGAFGLEALLRADPALLPQVATAELLDELIARQLGRNNALLRERVLQALKRLAPDVEAADKAAWTRWWGQTKATWAPAPWTAREQPTGAGGGTTAAAERAFDLYQHGLDMLICIDSTGSMQPTIDALGEALAEMADILDGISPKLRLGVVHYKDYADFGKQGAKVAQPFTANIRDARRELADLRADGGGDLPEAVLGGLTLALDDSLRWKPDANKLVVLIGDAPPHGNEAQAVVDLARAAHETPDRRGSEPTTGAKAAAPTTPFLISCIGVFLELQGKLREQEGYREFVDSQKRMREDFQAIAKAGGGIFVDVTFTFTDEKPKDPPKGKGKDANKGGSIASSATRRIVEHILVLSFGERFAREMRDFARIFYEYKEAKLIK
ncbi:MAG: VWA domain-containing protein [Planctomycetes bacterium]|nr:VWA domain-containing protein [Planctomycetota bacterium]